MEDFRVRSRLVHVIPRTRIIGNRRTLTMSEDRDRMSGQNEETEQEDVEAHKLAANQEPDQQDDDVEAHKLA